MKVPLSHKIPPFSEGRGDFWPYFSNSKINTPTTPNYLKSIHKYSSYSLERTEQTHKHTLT